MPSHTLRRFMLQLPLLAIIAVAGLLFLHGTPASAACPSNRIPWQGGCWYVDGANVPWFNWGCDFGCNALAGKSGGVSTNSAALAAGFQRMQGAGMHVARWWVFPGKPWQITTDASGAPTGINPAVYPDFDAALLLAQQYNIYFDFVLFCGASSSCLPTSWETNPAQQAALATALGTLFAHYQGNPHILSWEIFNEPDFDVWNGKISQQAAVSTAAAITASIHSHAPGTYATVGTGFSDGMWMFHGIGLDYYAPHWYDYMSSGGYCLICHPAAYYATAAENKPLVVGEFYTGTASTTPYSSAYRFNDWYTNGFAGAWAWSLFPSKTGDGMAIDLTAAQAFAGQNAAIGPTQPPPGLSLSPASPSPSPSIPPPSPSPSPTSYTTTATVSPGSVNRGGSETITVAVKSTTTRTALVDVEVYGPAGYKVFQKYYDNQTLTAGVAKTYTQTWTVPSTAATGTFTVRIGIFQPGWASLLKWNANAAQFKVT